MTSPTPILVLKGPRVEDVSNLKYEIKLRCGIRTCQCLLFPSIVVVGELFVVEVASIFNSNIVPLLWLIRTIPRLQYFSGDTHYALVKVTVPGMKKDEEVGIG